MHSAVVVLSAVDATGVAYLLFYTTFQYVIKVGCPHWLLCCLLWRLFSNRSEPIAALMAAHDGVFNLLIIYVFILSIPMGDATVDICWLLQQPVGDWPDDRMVLSLGRGCPDTR